MGVFNCELSQNLVAFVPKILWPKSLKIRRDVGQLLPLIANVSSEWNEIGHIDNRKTALRTTV